MTSKFFVAAASGAAVAMATAFAQAAVRASRPAGDARRADQRPLRRSQPERGRRLDRRQVRRDPPEADRRPGERRADHRAHGHRQRGQGARRQRATLDARHLWSSAAPPCRSAPTPCSVRASCATARSPPPSRRRWPASARRLDPLIRQAYQAKTCSVLIDRATVVLGNPAMDITPAVVTALNAKITQFDLRPRTSGPGCGRPASTQTPSPSGHAGPGSRISSIGAGRA
jgi:hypothetical protein